MLDKLEEQMLRLNLKKNADKVSSFCNDVIGDICGIISGAARRQLQLVWQM